MKSTAHETRDDQRGIRERILAAAMTALREDGIRGLSQVQIARRAKVRQSHLTYYFAKRHDLIEAVAGRFLEGITHAFDQAVTASAVTGGRSPLLEHLTAVIVDRGHMRMFAAMILEADDDPKVRAILVRTTIRLQSILADALGGDDADDRASIALASLWGLGLYDFLMRPKRPPAHITSYISSLTGAPARRTGRERSIRDH